MDNQFFYRVKIYLAERFPLPLTISSTLFGMVGLYLLWLSTTAGSAATLSWTPLIAFISFFLLTFIMRLFDELKDREVDQVLFPERLLVKGDVKYEDIHILLVVSLIFWIPFNYIFAGSPVIFTVLAIYAFGFFKYFFIPQILSKNILLALITHNPIMFLASFYVCTIFSASQGLDLFTLNNVLVSLVFWVPSISWETARKIRIPPDEDDYQTYSKLVGPYLAAMIPLVAIFIQALCLHFLSMDMQLKFALNVLGWGLFVIYLLIMILFMMTLNRNISKMLQQVTEFHILFFSLGVGIICGIEVFL